MAARSAAPGRTSGIGTCGQANSLDAPRTGVHKAVLSEVLSGRHQRLGDAVLAAQAAYAQSGAFPELLRIYHLFGDPALRLR